MVMGQFAAWIVAGHWLRTIHDSTLIEQSRVRQAASLSLKMLKHSVSFFYSFSSTFPSFSRNECVRLVNGEGQCAEGHIVAVAHRHRSVSRALGLRC